MDSERIENETKDEKRTTPLIAKKPASKGNAIFKRESITDSSNNNGENRALVKIVILGFRGKDLSDPFFTIRTKDCVKQPRMEEAVYLPVDEKTQSINFQCRETIPLRSSIVGSASLTLKEIMRAKGRELRLNLVDSNGSFIPGRLLVRAKLCEEKDALKVSVSKIKSFSFEDVTSNTTFLIAGESGGTRAEVQFQARRERAKNPCFSLNQSLLLQEQGKSFKLIIEEMRSERQIGHVIMNTCNLVDGRYQLRDNSKKLCFEAHLAFEWIEGTSTSSFQNAQTENTCMNKDNNESKNNGYQDESYRQFSNNELILDGIIWENSKLFQEGTLEEKEKWLQAADDATKNFVKYLDQEKQKSKLQETQLVKENSSLLHKLDSMSEKVKFLETQMARKVQIVDNLDETITELKDENQHLKRTIRHLAPHWDRIEFTFSDTPELRLPPPLSLPSALTTTTSATPRETAKEPSPSTSFNQPIASKTKRQPPPFKLRETFSYSEVKKNKNNKGKRLMCVIQ